MKVYRDIYQLIISPENLFAAWRVFKSDKRNKPDVIQFERHLEQNIFRLHRELRDKTYRHGGYYGFWIRDPKLRRIHKATVTDRVLHHAIFTVLNPIFEPTFIPTSFSCRIGKGTHKGVEKVAQMLRAESKNSTRPCFALKCDVRKFFDSVNHEVLTGILERKIKDPDAMWLLKGIVDSFSDTKGIPIGNLTSQLFANLYMNEFDQFIKQELKVLRYARYTDDFIIVSRDEAYLASLLPLIRGFLGEKLALELHPNKITIRKYRQGIDFLGYVVLPGHTAVRTKTRKRMFRKMKNRVKQYKKGTIKEETLFGSLRSYMGVLSHADARQLEERLKNDFWFRLKE
jgi:retron-type reverse transcriptase